MPYYKKKLSDEDRDKIFSEAKQWRHNEGKQTYKFVTDFKDRPNPRCQFCEKTVYNAERISYNSVVYHKDCFRCLFCLKTINSAQANPIGPTVFVCDNHTKKILSGTYETRDGEMASAKSMSAGYNTGPSVVVSTDVDKMNEIDLGPGLEWRNSGKKQVYRYKYDENAAKKGQSRCNKCGKVSLMAETVTYEMIPYHKKCFVCMLCGKFLTPANATPFGETEFLCDPHFKRAIFGGTSRMSVSNDSNDGPIVTGAPKKSFSVHPDIPAGYKWRVDKGKQTYKYPEDLKSKVNPRCNKCGKKTYPAEMVTYEKVPYHKDHFRCLQCDRRLTAANATPFGEDVFLCDAHFAQFGQGGGFGEDDTGGTQSFSNDQSNAAVDTSSISTPASKKKSKEMLDLMELQKGYSKKAR